MKTQRDLFPLGRNKWGYRLWRILLGARGLFGVIFFGLAAPAFASATLDALVNAAARFSAAIGQQLVMLKNDPAPAEFTEKTVAYAEAKTAYFTALREEMPELNNIATRRKLQLLQLDNFIMAFSLASEKQQKVADEKTRVLLKRLSGDPDVDKAGVEFERAQKTEESFHEDFDGIDFTIYSRTTSFCLLIRSQPKLVVVRPLGKLDLGNQEGFDPVATFHDSSVIPRPHLPRDFSGKLIKGQDACFSFWSLP